MPEFLSIASDHGQGKTMSCTDPHQTLTVKDYFFRAPWFMVKNPPSNAGNMGSISGSGTSPGEENGNLLQCSCLGNPMDREAWWATAHGVAKESDMTEQWTITMCSKGRRPDLFLSHGPTSLVQCHPEQRYPGVTGGDYAAQLQEVPAWSCENLAGSRHACWLSKKEILLPVSSQLLRPASLSLPQIITSQKNRGNQEEWVQIFHFWNFSKREYMSPS